ncbi:MAG TPA: hypothetical protein VI197_23555 [Polyangiaceae bacterium]
MMLKAPKHSLLALVLLFTGASLIAGCSDEDEDEETHHEAAPDCAAIGDVCTHDVTGALADECHEVYHSNDAAECAERKEECVDFCTSHQGEGGGSGAEH